MVYKDRHRRQLRTSKQVFGGEIRAEREARMTDYNNDKKTTLHIDLRGR